MLSPLEQEYGLTFGVALFGLVGRRDIVNPAVGALTVARDCLRGMRMEENGEVKYCARKASDYLDRVLRSVA